MIGANSSNKSRKKRKVEDEHLESPVPKHKLRSHHKSPLPQNQLLQQQPPLTTCTEEENNEMAFGNIGVAQHMGSVTDSNSFAGETDSATSLYHDGRFKPDFPEVYAYDHPSTSSSSTSCGTNNSSSTACFLSSSSDKEITTSGDREVKPMNLQAELQFQPGNAEYPGFLLPGNDQHEQCSDAVGVEEVMLDADTEKPKTYILSSGRWSINRDNRFSSKKPTIDEEFEQYFSMLML